MSFPQLQSYTVLVDLQQSVAASLHSLSQRIQKSAVLVVDGPQLRAVAHLFRAL